MLREAGDMGISIQSGFLSAPTRLLTTLRSCLILSVIAGIFGMDEATSEGIGWKVEKVVALEPR